MNAKRILKSLLTVGLAALTVVGASLLMDSKKVEASTLIDVNVVSRTWEKSGDYWYWRNNDGSYARGWKQIGGEWYFFKDSTLSGSLPNGAMLANTVLKSYNYNQYYAFMPDGRMCRGGWCDINGNWVHAANGGLLDTGWKKIGGYWYYFDKYASGHSCAAVIGKQYIDGQYWMFDDNNHLVYGWSKLAGYWVYADPNTGVAAYDGWYKIGGSWYCFTYQGLMYANGAYRIDGNTYGFAANGKMLTGWQKIDGNWFYFGASSGKAKTDWQFIGNKWYYFDWQGRMYTNYYFYDGGVRYHADANGVVTKA